MVIQAINPEIIESERITIQKAYSPDTGDTPDCSVCGYWFQSQFLCCGGIQGNPSASRIEYEIECVRIISETSMQQDNATCQLCKIKFGKKPCRGWNKLLLGGEL